MKTKFLFASAFAALAGFAGLASTASAKTDVHIGVAIGGFPPPPVVVVDHSYDRAPSYGYDRDDRDDRGRSHGYWKEVVTKTWVPARWVITRDRWGREVRTFERGYMDYRTDRVWVEYDRDHDRDNGHHYGWR
jgi:hypothetical protein